MTDALWFALSTLALLGAYAQFQRAWFLYQVRKRRRADVSARLRLVINNSPARKDSIA